MTSLIERSSTTLQDHLEPHETVIAATRAQVDGGTMRIATRTGAGVGLGLGAGVVAASRQAADGSDLEAQLANGVVIAVTGSRILLLDVTAVGAKPKSLVVHIERETVIRVVTGEKRVMLVKMMTIALVLAGDQIRELRFEIPKTARREAEGVAAELGA